MSKNTSPRAHFGIRFSLLARRWRRVIDAELAKAGLSDATWVPLVHLQQTGGGLTQKELAALVGIDGSSLVRVLDILEREGVIERRRGEADARARLIYLTPAGKERVQQILKALRQVENQMLTDLSDADIGALLEGFEAIEQRITTLDERVEASRKT